MAAVEYVAGAFVLLGVSFLFVDIAFRLERKHDPDSVFDFFDAIRLLFFAIGGWFALLSLNFGKAVVDGSTTNMASIFDTTIITYTLAAVLLVFLGFVYVFVVIPRLIKKAQIKRENADEEVIKYG